MGWIKGSGKGAGREKRKPPPPLPLSFFCRRTYPTGYYFYSPQSSYVKKSKMAATTIRICTRFRPPKIHCRLSMIGLTLQATISNLPSGRILGSMLSTMFNWQWKISLVSFFFLWRDNKLLKGKWITRTIYSKLKLKFYCSFLIDRLLGVPQGSVSQPIGSSQAHATVCSAALKIYTTASKTLKYFISINKPTIKLLKKL